MSKIIIEFQDNYAHDKKLQKIFIKKVISGLTKFVESNGTMYTDKENNINYEWD